MKKILSIIVTLFMVCGSVAVYAGSDGFSDVSNNHWAKNEIQSFATRNIVTGYGDGTFAPDAGVTREEFCKMLLLTFDADVKSSGSAYFADVPADRWSANYIFTCKDMLTGYSNPFGGKPSFHPEEYATREDIAVALVRMMGLSETDVRNANTAVQTFRDGSSISPALVPFVSLAVERGLINGYTDKTFCPQKGITRAEIVVLLNRATKQSVSQLEQELTLNVEKNGTSGSGDGTISITTDEGATVTVNGESVSMSTNGYGKFVGDYKYSFSKEGEMELRVVATKAGKTSTKTVSVDHSVDSPEIEITSCPETVDKNSVTIRGTVTDPQGGTVTLTVNGEKITLTRWDSSFSINYKLEDGENTIRFVATNEFGKTSTKTCKVTTDLKKPNLSVNDIPATTTEKIITVSGKATSYGTTVRINGEKISLDWRDSFTREITLQEGKNTITVTATGYDGGVTTVTKTITYKPEQLEIIFNNWQNTSNNATLSATGTVTGMGSLSMTVNGNPVSVSGKSWAYSADLKQGDNAFTFVLTNDDGNKTTVTKNVSFTTVAPEFTLNSLPDVTDNYYVDISGKLSGSLDGVKVYINDKLVRVSNGEFSESKRLSDGENQFVVRATNDYGLTTSKVVTITYGTITAPTLSVDIIDTPTERQSITVSGIMHDTYDKNAVVYVNDKRANMNSNGSWSVSVSLSEGQNDIIVVAENKFGKTTTVVRKVTYSPAKEEVVTPPPTTVDDKETNTENETTDKETETETTDSEE